MALSLYFLGVLVCAAIVLITAHHAVKNSVKIAKHFKLSDEFTGMTILAIGTSIPEIMTHIVGSISILRDKALLHEVSGLVVGTNIGSDIFQQNFLIGVVALIGVVVVTKKHLMKDVGGLVGAAVLVWVFSYNGFLSRLEGGILFIGYIAYLFVLKKYGVVDKQTKKLLNHDYDHTVKRIVLLVLCFAIMAIAADRMLAYSEVLVDALPISASFFGIIVLGIATAFPELMTSVIAAWKKKAKISAGILIGSNITNPMFALGLGALISTYTVPSVVVFYDLPVKIITALLILGLLWKGKLSKRSGILLIIIYLVYLFVRNMMFPVDVLL